MTPSIYINLEDDVAAIALRLKREKAAQVILVCPKRCFLFSDAVNLKLLKKQADLIGKEVFILTMDEKGRGYAQAAGFGLRHLPGAVRGPRFSDVSAPVKQPVAVRQIAEPAANPLANAVQEVKNFVSSFGKQPAEEQASPVPAVIEPAKAQTPVVFEETPAVQPAAVQPSAAALYDRPVTTVDIVPEAAVKDTIFPKEFDQAMLEKRRKKANRRSVAAMLAAALLILLALVFVVLPKAAVQVYPKTEPVTRDLSISIGTAVAAPDSNQMTLPAAKVSEQLQESDTFQSQGKKEVGNKAQGTVQIYNFTKQPINLKSSTTVLSVNGQTYTLVPDLVQIQPTRYSNASTKEVDPSSLGQSIQIVATDGGENFNLPAGTRIEITNQVFGSKPQYLYAKTDTPVTGGVSRYLSVVTDQDLAAAQDSLKSKMIDDLRQKLSQNGQVLLDNAYSLQNIQFTADKATGTESPNFSASMTATVAGLAFAKNDMSTLIFDHVNQSIPDSKTLRPTQDVDNSYKVQSVDVNAGAGVVTAHFEGEAVYKVDVGGLAGQLVGKTPSQVNDILTSRPEIDHIDVTLAPNWQRTFPWFSQKISVGVQQ